MLDDIRFNNRMINGYFRLYSKLTGYIRISPAI